ncbi:carnitine/choline acetyltransferase [Strigomonas culicis]|uniref:Carnitine/choline acetyltransferase n=1 Tax=Strigomonas culicis TaxID=28005 RepID=S9UMK4_9TRYP|nr:carnitine/choline acetyltransferase [Strigomonas culicis]|eukprot:EPY29969.1 carnitine/choline acetyltransferase [Strigomonas culicis]
MPHLAALTAAAEAAPPPGQEADGAARQTSAARVKLQAAVAAELTHSIATWVQNVARTGLPASDRLLAVEPGAAALSFDTVIEHNRQHLSAPATDRFYDLSPLATEFGRSRIPAPTRDAQHVTPAERLRHVVVLHDGYPYLLDVFQPNPTGDAQGLTALAKEDIQRGFEYILSITPDSDNPSPVSVLTAANRTLWAKAYQELVGEGAALEGGAPSNAATLQLIHEAMLVVCLDSRSWGGHEKFAEASAMHGGVEEMENRWYDKHQLIVSADGRVAFNFESSRGDRVQWARWIDDVLRQVQEGAAPPPAADEAARADVTHYTRPLEITFGKSFATHIRNARTEAKAIVGNMEVHSIQLPFGHRHLQALNALHQAGLATPTSHTLLSSGAFMEVCLQVAHAQLRDRLSATSQLCGLPFFFHGQTELVRCASPAVAQLVKRLDLLRKKELQLAEQREAAAAAAQPPLEVVAAATLSATEQEELARLAVAAMQQHRNLYHEALAGGGIHRHLEALQHTATNAGDAVALDFFQDPLYALTERFLLHTSHFAQPWLQHYTVGPARENGYGVGYVLDAEQIRVSITAFTNSPATDLAEFSHCLVKTADMLFEVLGGNKLK